MAALTPAGELAANNPIRHPNESEDYRRARQELLVEEIELRRHAERVASLRRDLPPGGEVPGDYHFVAEDGSDVSLSGLFGEKDTLVIYSYMFGPQREAPCPMCTSLMGGLDHKITDIRQRVAIAFTARSPIGRLIEAKASRGWSDLPVYSDTAVSTRGPTCRRRMPTCRDTTCSPAVTASSATSGVTRSPVTWPTPVRIRGAQSRWTRSGSCSTLPLRAAEPTGTPA